MSAFSISSLSSRRKLVVYLNSSLNSHLKNVYFYQGMTPISKVKTLLAFVSICVCNVQCKLEIPIVLHGTWSVGIMIRRHLHPWLPSLNWKYRKIDKWYTNKIVVNCCQINCQQMKYQPGQHFIPSYWYDKNCFENMEKKTVTPIPFYMHQLVTCHLFLFAGEVIL